jgi:hypothetical protein
MVTFNTANPVSANVTGVPRDLSRRFLRQQQAQLDELFSHGDINDAIRELASQVCADTQRTEPCRFPCLALAGSRLAA